MPELSASCDGTNGTTCTAANTGFDSITIGTGGTCVFDTSVKLFGTASIKVQSGTGAQAEPAWVASLGTVTKAYARFYLRLGAYPGSSQRVMFGFRNSGTEGFGFDLSTTGQLITKNAVSGSWGTTVAIPLNQWVRVEMDVLSFSTTTSAPVARLYLNPLSTTADSSLEGIGTNTGASANAFSLPIRNASLGPMWIDQVAVSTTAQPGPYLVPGGDARVSDDGYRRRRSGLLVR